MAGADPILRAGLTGGIASGKSIVAGFFEELGAFVVDADAVAHEVMALGGGAYAAIVAHFGPEILDDADRIDRTRLGQRVFGDPREREALEAIVHPLVRREAERRIAEYAREAQVPLAVFDAALLVETGAYRGFDRLVVVRCGRETQLKRLRERGELTAEEAAARLAAQAPVEEKLAVADYVIDTDGSLDQTHSQTERVFGDILHLHPKWGKEGS